MLVQSVENKEEGQEGRSYSVKLLEVVTRLRFITWSQRSSNWVVACPFQAGCVHFPPVPQCDVKVLLLIFSPKKRAFVGLIPVEQVRISFVYVTLHVYENCVVWRCLLRVTLISLGVLVYNAGCCCCFCLFPVFCTDWFHLLRSLCHRWWIWLNRFWFVFAAHNTWLTTIQFDNDQMVYIS